jgi:hypothetical protein
VKLQDGQKSLKNSSISVILNPDLETSQQWIKRIVEGRITQSINTIQTILIPWNFPRTLYNQKIEVPCYRFPQNGRKKRETIIYSSLAQNL